VSGSGTGSGPVDAAYRIVDKLIKHKTKLLDYQIRSVTVGKDAQGEVTVKIQGEGDQTLVGRGLSTDVIEASIHAYLDAINRGEAHKAAKKGRATYGV
jgi:2-isopropylmalate synthase